MPKYTKRMTKRTLKTPKETVKKENKVKKAAKAVKIWVKKGMPLPGAKYAPAGKSYMRGKLINSPKTSKPGDLFNKFKGKK